MVCVLRIGREAFKRTFNPEWVRLLRAMVKRHLTLPHRFVCLSNVGIAGVECLPLTDDLPSWWSKIELFKHPFEGRVLYLDLDVIVTGVLDDIALYPAPIAFTPSHSVLLGKPLRTRPGLIECYQTSCMVWEPPHGRVIYEQFRRDVMMRLKGDQDWIAEVYPYWPKMPKEWFCKLRQCPQGPPDGVRVVLSIPWKNDEASRKFPWVREIWLEGKSRIPPSRTGDTTRTCP